MEALLHLYIPHVDQRPREKIPYHPSRITCEPAIARQDVAVLVVTGPVLCCSVA